MNALNTSLSLTYKCSYSPPIYYRLCLLSIPFLFVFIQYKDNRP